MLEWLVKNDIRLFQFVNHQLANPICDLVMPLVTLLGDRYVATTTGVLTACLGRHKTRRTGVLMVVALVLGLLLAVAIKRLIGRPRPMARLMGVHLVGEIPPFESFPSAHAAVAFAMAGILVLRHPHVAWWAIPLASLVGFSRIYMGLHYPSDVVAGAMVGVAVAVIVIGWVEHRNPLRSMASKR